MCWDEKTLTETVWIRRVITECFLQTPRLLQSMKTSKDPSCRSSLLKTPALHLRQIERGHIAPEIDSEHMAPEIN